MKSNNFRSFATTIKVGVFLLIMSNIAYSQQFGGHILGQNWQILDSPAAKVIYPFGLDSQAQRVANLVNFMDKNNRRSIGKDKKNIQIVLHGQTVNPNGYVSLAPFRSEFFGTPPQSNLMIGSLGWMDVLTVHEYRHALQFMNSNHGMSSVAYFLGGQRSWAVAVGFGVPDWYFEGDAVIAETALSKAGRGRSPFFTLEQRALAHANINYSYTKNRNGSYRDIVPNRYPLGYMMLSKARELKGNDITAKVFRETVRYETLIAPFSKAMKKYVGYKTPKLYDLAWKNQKEKWFETLQKTELIPTTELSKKSKIVTDYRFPIVIEDEIYARKSSYQKIESIVRIKDGNEEELVKIGYNADENLTYNAGILAWTEFNLNARRSFQEFSNIILYKIKDGKPYQFTENGRYFSPAVSPDGSSVAAIHISPNQENEIQILDISSGQIIKKIANPNHYVLARIAWSPDGKDIITIAKANNQIALMKYSINENTSAELSPWTSHTLESPNVVGNRVYFNASFSGIDNIFYTDLAGTKVIFQLTSVPVGAFEPNVDAKGENLIFTEFTEMGYKISKQNLKENEPKAIEIIEPIDMPQYKTQATVAEGGSILERNYKDLYPTKSYKGLFKGQSLHSWGPLIAASSSSAFLGIQSSNYLNDVSFEAGLGSNLNENNLLNYTAALKIARFYPEIKLVAEKINRQTDFTNKGEKLSKADFNEIAIGSEISIPFNWLKKTFLNSFEPMIGFYQKKISNFSTDFNEQPNFNFKEINAGFKFRHLQKTAPQNIGPRFGFKLNANFLQAIEGNNQKININSKIYLPGFHPNHQFLIKAAFQKEPLTNQYQYIDEFEYPRGAKDIVNDQFSLLSLNYGLPIAYPDMGGGFMYCKRIRTNLFLDAGLGINQLINRKNKYNSSGIELIFDNTYFNLLPLSLGIRASYLWGDNPDFTNKIVPGFVLDIDL